MSGAFTADISFPVFATGSAHVKQLIHVTVWQASQCQHTCTITSGVSICHVIQPGFTQLELMYLHVLLFRFNSKYTGTYPVYGLIKDGKAWTFETEGEFTVGCLGSCQVYGAWTLSSKSGDTSRSAGLKEELWICSLHTLPMHSTLTDILFGFVCIKDVPHFSFLGCFSTLFFFLKVSTEQLIFLSCALLPSPLSRLCRRMLMLELVVWSLTINYCAKKYKGQQVFF